MDKSGNGCSSAGRSIFRSGNGSPLVTNVVVVVVVVGGGGGGGLVVIIRFSEY